MSTAIHDEDSLPESPTTHDEEGLPLMTNADFRWVKERTPEQFEKLPQSVREAYERTKRWLGQLD